jgi:Zn finger protein HypA/HybF involved in hydrogenase expression
MIASLLCPLGTVVTLGYAAVCAASPFGTCRRCAGLGRVDRIRGLHSRACPRCDATGIRIRRGRHLYHLAARIYRDGTH